MWRSESSDKVVCISLETKDTIYSRRLKKVDVLVAYRFRSTAVLRPFNFRSTPVLNYLRTAHTRLRARFARLVATFVPMSLHAL